MSNNNTEPIEYEEPTEAELAKKYLDTLKKNEFLGLGWKLKLDFLYKKNFIKEDEFCKYWEMHKTFKKKSVDEVKQFTDSQKIISKLEPCSVCGDLINAGTSGHIFQKRSSPSRVIKGSVKKSVNPQRCPDEFDNEINMIQKINTIFKDKEFSSLSLVQLIEPLNVYMENSTCYYEMDKIFPYEIDKTLEQKIQQQIASLNENDSYFLTIFLQKSKVTMLTPGITDHFNNVPGNEKSSWFEIGEKQIKMLFSLLGINYNDYCESLILILKHTLEKKIILTDVEFILGSVLTSDGYKNGIFMIDFDKVTGTITPVTKQQLDNLLIQDMFPNRVRTEVKFWFNQTYRKKYLKYKKKYVNLKNKINLN